MRSTTINVHDPNARLFFVLIDDLAVTLGSMPRVKTVLRELVETSAPSDRFGVSFMDQAWLDEPVTGRANRMASLIDRLPDALGTNDKVTFPAFLTKESHPLLLAMERLHYARRALVVISVSGRVESSRTSDPAGLERLTRRMNVPIHTVDVYGSFPRRFDQDEDLLQSLPRLSRGLGILNRTDLSGAAAEIVSTSSAFYRVQFAPKPAPGDGAFHPIVIHVKRPNLHIDAPQGYVAPLLHATASQAGSLMDEALAARVPLDGMPLRLTAARTADSSGTVTLDGEYAITCTKPRPCRRAPPG